MYIGFLCKLIRMTVGSCMSSNFRYFIYLSLPIPRPIPLPPPLPLSLHPSPSPLFCISLSLYPPSLYISLSISIPCLSLSLSPSLSLSRKSIEHPSKIYPAAFQLLSFLSRYRLISPFLSALLYRSQQLPCLLHLLCWILVEFVYWIFDCFVSVASLCIKPLISCTHILVALVFVV